MRGSGWTLLRWAGVSLALVVGAGWYLGLGQGVSPADWGLVGEFFSAALQPTLVDQDLGQSLLPILANATWQTVRFAMGGLFLACLLGLPLGLASATCVAGKWAWGPRLLASSLRAVHELLWAILILAALGRSEGAAVLAIALPYAGTLAKVFSELLDEAPQQSHRALLEQGARPAQAVLLGLLPRVVPDLVAYVFYRFECALRSAAVLGFFGFPTLGLVIAQAAENLHYRELWLYLYALLAVVLLAEFWSARLRKGLTLPLTSTSGRPA